jgi:hypothetical protein
VFEVGKVYRVRYRTSDSGASKKGALIERDGDVIALDIEGVKTIFHIGGGSIIYIEEVDDAAERERSRKRTERQIASWS